MRGRLLVALVLSGCATTSAPKPEAPLALTFAWPKSLVREATLVLDTRVVDVDGEQSNHNALRFEERIDATPDGFVIDTDEALAIDGAPGFRAFADQQNSVVSVDAAGTFVAFERKPSRGLNGLTGRVAGLGERLGGMLDEQLAHEARARWRELVELWRGRAVDGAPWRLDDGTLVQVRRGVSCVKDGAPRCVRIHALSEDPAPKDAQELFRAMARTDATLGHASRRRELVVITEPDTLLPWSYTVTDASHLEGTVGAKPVTWAIESHVELSWQPREQ